jgi:hypothetical protein
MSKLFYYIKVIDYKDLQERLKNCKDLLLSIYLQKVFFVDFLKGVKISIEPKAFIISTLSGKFSFKMIILFLPKLFNWGLTFRGRPYMTSLLENIKYQRAWQDDSLYVTSFCSRCKKSARKHKKWEGDAILTVRHDARLAILKDMVTLPHEIVCCSSHLRPGAITS